MKREWAKDYHEKQGTDGRTRYVYTGDRFELTSQARRVYACRVMPPLALAAFFLAAAGFVNAPCSRVLYVALPWAAGCFAAALALFDAARILLTRRRLTARDHHAGALRLKKTLAWAAALSVLSAGGNLLYLLLNGLTPDGALFALFSIGVLPACLIARRQEAAAEWKRIPHGDGAPGF